VLEENVPEGEKRTGKGAGIGAYFGALDKLRR